MITSSLPLNIDKETEIIFIHLKQSQHMCILMFTGILVLFIFKISFNLPTYLTYSGIIIGIVFFILLIYWSVIYITIITHRSEKIQNVIMWLKKFINHIKGMQNAIQEYDIEFLIYCLSTMERIDKLTYKFKRIIGYKLYQELQDIHPLNTPVLFIIKYLIQKQVIKILKNDTIHLLKNTTHSEYLDRAINYIKVYDKNIQFDTTHEVIHKYLLSANTKNIHAKYSFKLINKIITLIDSNHSYRTIKFHNNIIKNIHNFSFIAGFNYYNDMTYLRKIVANEYNIMYVILNNLDLSDPQHKELSQKIYEMHNTRL